MTHFELLAILKKKLPKLNRPENQILKETIAGLGDKDNSLYRFYKELSTNGYFLDLANIEKVAKNYSVPILYKDLINSRFDKFKLNLKSICQKNQILIDEGKKPGYDPTKWIINGRNMFQTTEEKTINHVGGIEAISKSIYTIGYFDYLKKVFLESATETSRLKYSLLLSEDINTIEYNHG